MFDVILQPLQLIAPERPESSGLEIQHIHQADKMHAVLVEAVPARAARFSSKTLEELLSIVVQHVVLSGDVEDFFRLGAFKNLLDGVKFLRLRQMADVAGVQNE